MGRDGRTFELLKFRSMAASHEQGDTTWNIDTSDRLGSVGRFIRRTGIDELPQLWNILRGDMSLVGPRPERPHFVEQFSEDTPGYRHRHRMRTGLTGLGAGQRPARRTPRSTTAPGPTTTTSPTGRCGVT